MEYLLITLLAVETLVLIVVWRRKRTWKRRAIAASPTVWGEIRRLFIEGLREDIDSDYTENDQEWPSELEAEPQRRGDAEKGRHGDAGTR